MAQIFEFIGNHPLLIAAFVGVLGVLAFTEYNRMFSGVKQLSPFAATQMLNSGEAVFVDVRSDNEFKSGHIINARNMPANNFDKHIHELEKHKEKDVIVYCESGMRAQKVISKLRKSGFTSVHTIAGGLGAWEKANLPTVSK